MAHKASVDIDEQSHRELKAAARRRACRAQASWRRPHGGRAASPATARRADSGRTAPASPGPRLPRRNGARGRTGCLGGPLLAAPGQAPGIQRPAEARDSAAARSPDGAARLFWSEVTSVGSVAAERPRLSTKWPVQLSARSSPSTFERPTPSGRSFSPVPVTEDLRLRCSVPGAGPRPSCGAVGPQSQPGSSRQRCRHSGYPADFPDASRLPASRRFAMSREGRMSQTLTRRSRVALTGSSPTERFPNYCALCVEAATP